MKKLVFLAVVLIGFAATSLAQSASATANASANIQSALSITKNYDLSFGNIFVPAGTTTGGNVSLAATAAGTRTATATTGAVVLAPGAGSAAKFTIAALPTTGYTFSVPPGAITLTNTGALGGTMTFTLSTSPLSVTTDASGSAVFYVGGNLTVAANQNVGYYSNTTDLTVTVAHP
jgi:hypothetical protein